MSKDELGILYHFDFDNEKLNHVRDCFIIGCYTGMRFSDFSKLEKEQIVQINKTYIDIETFQYLSEHVQKKIENIIIKEQVKITDIHLKNLGKGLQ